MRKLLLSSIFAIMSALFIPLTGAHSANNPYFGFSAGYSFQELDLKGSLTASGTTVRNAKIKEDGFFFAPKAGLFLGDGIGGGIALEFEPRWTTASYEVQAENGTPGLDGAFHHVLLPLTAVIKAEGDVGGASLGVGSGVNFYDLGKEIHRVMSVPLIFKAGFAFSTEQSARFGLDAQLMISLWDSESNVDSVVSAGVGLKIEFN